MNKKSNNTYKIISVLSLIILFTLTACDQVAFTNRDKDLDLSWVHVPGGTFIMGSPDGVGEDDEHPQHPQTIGDLYVLKTEVTVKQYIPCIEDGTCWNTLNTNPTYCNYTVEDRIDHPMNCIDWHQANVYCAWIDARLPTEAEWEYIASNGGMDILHPWGNEEATCDNAVIDIDKENRGCGKWTTDKVCSRPKGNNKFGLCDLAGNVFEWVSGWYYIDYRDHQGEPPPTILNLKTQKSNINRMMRGGGIGSDEKYRIKNRVYHDPNFDYAGLGVRCVRDAKHFQSNKLKGI